MQVFDEGTSLLFVGLTGWMADMPQQVQLLSDILGRPVRAFRLGYASALGTALLSGAVDRERYSVKNEAGSLQAK